MRDIKFHIGVDIKKWLGEWLQDPELPVKTLLDKQGQDALLRTGRIYIDDEVYPITAEVYEKGVVYHFGTHPKGDPRNSLESYSEGYIIVGPGNVHYIITGISDRLGPFDDVYEGYINDPEWQSAALEIYNNMASKNKLVYDLGRKIATSKDFFEKEMDDTRNPIKMIKNNVERQSMNVEKEKQMALFRKAVSESFERLEEAYKLREVDGAYADYFKEEQNDKSR